MKGASRKFTALLDACVLGGALRRNMLLSLAEVDLFRPRWTLRILEETEKAIFAITNGQNDGSRPREAIEGAFPHALVASENVFLHAKFVLPDPNDIHVLEAALSASASIIVTDNLRHFPVKCLSPFAIKAMTADSFIGDIIERDPEKAISALKRMRMRFNKPTLDVSALVELANLQGLSRVASLMRKYRGRLN